MYSVLNIHPNQNTTTFQQKEVQNLHFAITLFQETNDALY